MGQLVLEPVVISTSIVTVSLEYVYKQMELQYKCSSKSMNAYFTSSEVHMEVVGIDLNIK